jgi:hypothetical protein
VNHQLPHVHNIQKSTFDILQPQHVVPVTSKYTERFSLIVTSFRYDITMNVQEYDAYHNSLQDCIPATLQAVFLASNRGKEVNKPPPASVASKVFFHNWLIQRQTESKERDVPSSLKTKKVKKLKKKTKQESPKGTALHLNPNPKANVSAAFSTQLKMTLDTID